MSERRIIGLKQAAAAIRAGGAGDSGGYCFCFGSGLSGQVPGAEELSRELLSREDSPMGYPFGSLPGDRYGELVARSLADPRRRQDRFRELSRPDPAPEVYLAARLLIAGRPARVALTGNFDDSLARAARHFGAEPDVYGTRENMEEYRFRDDRLQLIYLNGTWKDYRLPGEAPEPDPARRTAEAVLRQRSPLVIGFSGRERGPFLLALEDVLKENALPRPMFWFLHRRDEWHRIPAWIRNHESVWFVAPEGAGEPRRAIPFGNRDLNRFCGTGLESLISGDGENRLGAREILGALAVACDAGMPDLIGNPVRFLETRRNLLLEHYTGEDDFCWQPAGLPALSPLESPGEKGVLEKADDLIRRARYREAAEFLLTAGTEGLDSGKKEEFLRRCLFLDRMCPESTEVIRELLAKGMQLAMGMDRTVRDERVLTLGLRSARLEAARGGGARVLTQLDRIRYVVKNLEPFPEEKDTLNFLQALGLMQENRREEARQWLRDELYGTEAVRKLLPLYRGYLEMTREDFDSAVKELEPAGEEFSVRCLRALAAVSTGSRELLPGELANLADEAENREGNLELGALLTLLRAVVMQETQVPELALKGFNRLLNRYEGAWMQPVRRYRALGYLGKAELLRRQGSLIEAGRVLGRLREEYLGDTDPLQEILTARSFLNSVSMKQELNWKEEVLEDCGRFRERFSGTQDPEICRADARIRFTEALTVRELGRTVQGAELLSDLYNEYARQEDPEIRLLVCRSLMERSLLEEELGDVSRACATLNLLQNSFDGAREEEMLELLARSYTRLTGLENGAGRPDQAREAGIRGISRLQDILQPEVREQTGQIYLETLRALSALDKHPETVALAVQFADGFSSGQEDREIRRLAEALHLKGLALEKAGRPEEALETFESYLERYGELKGPAETRRKLDVLMRRGTLEKEAGWELLAASSWQQLVEEATGWDRPEDREILAQAWLARAGVHMDGEQYGEVTGSLSRMIGFFGDRLEPGWIPLNQARLERGRAYALTGNREMALEDFSAIRQLPDGGGTGILEIRAAALHQECSLLLQMEQYGRLREITAEIPADLAGHAGREVRSHLMAVLRSRQQALEKLDLPGDMVDNADRILELFRGENPLEFRMHLGHTYLEKIRCAYRLRKHDLVDATREELEDFVQDSTGDPHLQDLLVQALVISGNDLSETGAYREALEVFGRTLSAGPGATEELLRGQVQARYRTGQIHQGMGREREALKAFQEIEKSHSGSRDPVIRPLVLKSILEQSQMQADRSGGLFGRSQLRRVLARYTQVEQQARGQKDPEMVKIFLRTVLMKGQLLGELKQRDEAIRLYQETMGEFGESTEPWVLQWTGRIQKELDRLGTL